MKIDVLMLNFQDPSQTLLAMQSLLQSVERAREQSPDLEVHFWVGDNGSKSEHLSQLKAKLPVSQSLHLIEHDRNLGFAAGMRSLWLAAQPQSWVLFLNSDTTVPLRFFDSLSKELTNLKPGSVLRLPVREASELFLGGVLQLWRLTGKMTEKPGGDFVSGCALVVSAQDFKESPFDPDFFFYGEDVDLSRRLRYQMSLQSSHEASVENLCVAHAGRGSTPSLLALRFHFAGRRLLSKKMIRSGQVLFAVAAIGVVSVELVVKSLAWLMRGDFSKLVSAWAGWLWGYPESRLE